MSRLSRSVRKYSAKAQLYGSWLRGYDWDVYMTGAFRFHVTVEDVKRLTVKYLRELDRLMGTRIRSVTAVEHLKPTGLGHVAVRPHNHMLLGGADPDQLRSVSKELWRKMYGDEKTVIYDPEGNACHYVSKYMAKQENDWFFWNVEREHYKGPQDLLLLNLNNPYVPERLAFQTSSTEFLTIREHR